MTVYFFQGETTGHVKIGFTRRSVSSRLASLQTGSPERLVCIGTIDGDDSTEADLHARFASLRLHGEWFRDGAELIDFVKENATRPEQSGPWSPRRGILYSGVLRNGVTQVTGRHLHKNSDGTLARLACVDGGEQWVRIETLRPLPDSEVVRQAVAEHNSSAQWWPW